MIEGELEEIRSALQMERRLSSEVIWTDIWRGRDMVSLLPFGNDQNTDLKLN